MRLCLGASVPAIAMFGRKRQLLRKALMEIAFGIGEAERPEAIGGDPPARTRKVLVACGDLGGGRIVARWFLTHMAVSNAPHALPIGPAVVRALRPSLGPKITPA